MTGSPKLFLGKHASTLDKKGRFPAPSIFQGQLSRGAYIIQGFDRNLLVLTPNAFGEIYRKISAQNLADPLARLLLRMILGTAHELDLDKNGYITLPKELKKFARVGRDVLLVGQGDYFEVWQPDLWERQEVQIRDAATNSSRFATLVVTTR